MMKIIIPIATLSVVVLSGCQLTDSLPGVAATTDDENAEISASGFDAMSCDDISDFFRRQNARVSALERTAITASSFGAGAGAQELASKARVAYNQSLDLGRVAMDAKNCNIAR